MLKMLSLHRIAHRYGARLLISTYVVIGIAVVPLIVLPERGDVENIAIKECHISCHRENGQKICIEQCSQKATTIKTQEPVTKAYRHGSTGPTVPPKPVGTRH